MTKEQLNNELKPLIYLDYVVLVVEGVGVYKFNALNKDQIIDKILDISITHTLKSYECVVDEHKLYFDNENEGLLILADEYKILQDWIDRFIDRIPNWVNAPITNIV